MLSIVLWGLAALCVVLALAPGLLSTVPGFAHVLAFPHLVGILLIVVGVLIAWKSRRLRVPATAVSVAAALLVIFPHASPLAPVPVATTSASAANQHLSLVTYNSKETFTAADFKKLHARFHPDVFVLPETDLKRAEIAFRGSNYRLFTSEEGNTTVAVASSISNYAQGTAPDITFGAVAIEHEGLPKIVGLHSAPPTPGLMNQWEGDLARVGEFDGAENVIVAGDFNATLRHGVLAEREQLVDAFQQCGKQGGKQAGTWPAAVPGWMRTQIDHVFVSPEMQVSKCDAVKIGRSDHVALAVTVTLPSAEEAGY
ncbi:endonuclease/exonuclease/phosphatase family protein [Corynebacterium sp. S7]